MVITILILFFWISTVQGQYSNYYNVLSQSNTNINARIKADVNHNVSGTVVTHNTINTIDYGALALANAQREKNQSCA